MLDPNNGYDVTTHQACAETVERMTTDIVLVNPPKSQAESIYGTGCNFDINLVQLVFARFHHRRHRSAVSRCSLLAASSADWRTFGPCCGQIGALCCGQIGASRYDDEGIYGGSEEIYSV